jgi:hypothetical protein
VDDGHGALTAAGLPCGSCGTELPPHSKFCNECGAGVIQVSRSAEYKQVTVLFADVVHSMDIAATVGAERLREIMTDLADRCAAVVQRYGGTVDKFTRPHLDACLDPVLPGRCQPSLRADKFVASTRQFSTKLKRRTQTDTG